MTYINKVAKLLYKPSYNTINYKYDLTEYLKEEEFLTNIGNYSLTDYLCNVRMI